MPMDNLIAKYHLHPIIDHFTIALCVAGVLADIVGYSIIAIVGNRSLSAREFGARLSRAAVVLLIPGALSAVLSRLTGQTEAERVWDSISPAAQRILLTDNGPRWFLSHAVLGTYLMYPLIAVAIWRVLLEISTTIARTQSAYRLLSVVVICGVLYQGKTGGELVYEHGVGTNIMAPAGRGS
jgi:uncharacterized membrane protein